MKNSTREKQNLAKRITGYAAAAGAMISLSPSVKAQVEWSGNQDISIGWGDTLKLDLDNNGIVDFDFTLKGSGHSSHFTNNYPYYIFSSWYRLASAYVFDAAIGSYNSWADYSSQPRGFNVGELIENANNSWYYIRSASHYGKLAYGRATYLRSYSKTTSNTNTHYGNFAGQSKFLGVHFYNGNQQHYGWVRANLANDMSHLSIIDWGYQAVPDSAIIAGGVEPVFINEKYYNNDTVQVELNFPLQVQNLATSNFAVTNGTVSNLYEDVPGEKYRVEINNITDGEVTLTLPQGGVDNTEGLVVLAKSTKFIVDTQVPIAIIKSDATITNKDTVTVSVNFSEKIKGLILDNFDVNNGTKSNFQVVTDSSYTFDITAVADGEVSISLPQGAVTDLAGNDNRSAFLNYMVDTHAPQTTIDPGLTTTNDTTIIVTVSFNEKIEGLTIGDFNITNGTTSNFKEITDSLVYSIDVTAKAEGEVDVQLPLNSVTDFAGNGNVLASASYTYITPVSIENITADNIVMYPNPASSTIHIKLNSEAAVTFINSAGETVLVKEHFLDDAINISGLKSGIYVVQIQQDKNVLHKKLIIE